MRSEVLVRALVRLRLGGVTARSVAGDEGKSSAHTIGRRITRGPHTLFISATLQHADKIKRGCLV